MDNEQTLEKKIKRSIFWDRFTYIFIAGLLAVSVLFSCFVLYQKFYFSTTWVSGQSMYPYLNSEVTNNGKKRTDGDVRLGDKNLDLVLVDNHENVMNSLNRFDIVIVNIDNAYDVIKRLIVLPGETFYFGSGDQQGELFIQNKNGTFDLIPQPIERKYLKEGDYEKYQNPDNPTTLSDSEYFVCGDNRGHSGDSRSKGPFERKNLKGVVVALIGHCDATTNSNSSITYTNVSYIWPRFIKS